MEKFTVLRSTVVALLRDHIDTDLIIRVEPLFDGTSRDQLGPHCFGSLRTLADGTPDPAFPLNQPRHAGARVLLAGENFGCGSSREGAVWALMAAGLRCVVAPSFGDIFYNNCFQNGLLPVRLPRRYIEAIAERAEADPCATVTVDLQACTLARPDGVLHPFTVPAPRRDALLRGLDDIDATLEHEAAIAEWQRVDAERRPWIHLKDKTP